MRKFRINPPPSSVLFPVPGVRSCICYCERSSLQNTPSSKQLFAFIGSSKLLFYVVSAAAASAVNLLGCLRDISSPWSKYSPHSQIVT